MKLNASIYSMKFNDATNCTCLAEEVRSFTNVEWSEDDSFVSFVHCTNIVSRLVSNFNVFIVMSTKRSDV